tara:strand:+ start:63202 stop:64755 length:1554 start_codon:yes stop_codon:yes gene_type:complete
MKKYIKKILDFKILFLPLLFYFGNRSYIAQDEGYYALQARWILETGNWFAPIWWNDAIFDRGIGVQWLIAFSQKLFGQNIYVAHIPSLISAILCLYLTSKIANKLIGEKYIWLSPIILSTTYLWINNAHLATQDMPLLAIELIGIWSLIKIKEKGNLIYLFIFGLWIGLAFLIKSLMVVLPLISLLPYIFRFKIFIIKSYAFLLGLIIGLIPLSYWLYNSVNIYGIDTVSNIIYKVKHLSETNLYSQSFLYYIWNTSLNTFPWSLFSLIGFYKLYKTTKKEESYMLTAYPFMLILLLSIFKTKTPYYALQLTPFIAINASLGLRIIVEKMNSTRRYFKYLISSIGISLILLAIYILIKNKFYSTLFPSSSYLILILILFIIGISWASICIFNTKKSFILLTIIGPYIAFSLAVQSGLFSDRDQVFKSMFYKHSLASIIKDKNVDFYFNNDLDNDEYSKLIKIALYTPNLGKRIEKDFPSTKESLIWININDLSLLKEKSTILYYNKIIAPWALIRKN